MDRLAQLLQFHQEDPEDPFLQFALAVEYLKLGQDTQALAFFESLIQNHPTYIGTYYHLGKLYEQLDRTEDAIAIYQRGIHIAEQIKDFHARAELQDALMQAQGIGWDNE